MPRTSLLLLPLLGLSALLIPLPTADAEDKLEPGKPVVLFNGKDLTGWKVKGSPKSKWVIGKAAVDEKNMSKLTATEGAGGEMINPDHAGDIYTEQKFGDGTFEVEFMYPKGSNSGVYLMGEYEIQILDSFGKDKEKLAPGDLGGLYNTKAPSVNAAKKAGEWQKFVIDYQTPRFEGDKKVSNMKLIKVTLNDQLIHENVEAKGPTGGQLTGKEAATGPLMFQGDHGPVAFRNIKFTPKK
ncbi:MAG: DUF1080 domain-containing protein [Gemmataceae bacterium]|nr:DUF1080 domain-containing protein [Gemmataceae bacterium]